MEAELREKIIVLEQSRMDTETKLAEAQSALKASVPREDMDKLRSSHGSLTRRHQELVLKHSTVSTQMLELKVRDIPPPPALKLSWISLAYLWGV